MKMLSRLAAGGFSAVCVAAVISWAAAQPQAQTGWRIYKADQTFGQVFGRPITIREERQGRTFDVEEPTLLQASAAKGDYGANRVAREAVAELLRWTETSTPRQCAGLTSLKLPWVQIRSAVEVAAAREQPQYCKVLGVIDREIGFEVDLPGAAAWNGKFLMGGGGGFLGNLQNGAKPVALLRGYATAATDAGHTEEEEFPAGGKWAYRNPERLINFAHRGTHLTAATAKLIIQAYYNKALVFSYYSGTSGSGRLAMMESQRYPMDFDGISAGCPGFSRAKGTLLNAWTQQAMYRTADDQYGFKPVVPPAKVKLLDAAVHDKCDAVDGLKDGLITDPRACGFNPRTDLQRCRGGEGGSNCFTDDEIEAIAKVHAGPSNSTGQIWPGFVYGGESIPGQWTNARGNAYVIGTARQQGAYSSRHYLLSNEQFRFLIYGDPDYDLHSFNFETDVPATLAAGSVLDADNADLSGFKSRGGKILFWQGWSDWAVNANATITYYERVLRTMGGAQQVTPFARLFMLPGLGHCTATDPEKKAPNVADFLTALEQWVEHGVAPTRIVASHVVSTGARGEEEGYSMPIRGTVDRTRPLCVYPELAAYKGSGDVDDQANFVCRAPAVPSR